MIYKKPNLYITDYMRITYYLIKNIKSHNQNFTQIL